MDDANRGKIRLQVERVRQLLSDSAMAADQGIIDLLGEKGSGVSAQGDDFEGAVMGQMLAFLTRLREEIARTVPQVPNVLLIGGSDMDVARILEQYPQARIKVVNLSREYLTEIRNRYQEISSTGQLQLFLADAQHLSSYRDADGSRYFPEGSFDIVAAPGVDATALPGEQGRAVLSRIAEEEVLLARKGGLIMHCYNVIDLRDSLTFQAQAVKDGVLEFVGEKETMSGSLFQRTDKVIAAPGGIDLNAVDRTLSVDSAGQALRFHIDPAMLEKLEAAPGITPVILNIQPMKDLRQFLGLREEETAASAS